VARFRALSQLEVAMLSSPSAPRHLQTVMKRMTAFGCCVFILFIALVFLGLHQGSEASENTGPDHQVSRDSSMAIRPSLSGSYGKLPLSFEPNRGQADPRVKFLAHGPGYTLFLTADTAVFVFMGKDTGAKLAGPKWMKPTHSSSSSPFSALSVALLGPLELASTRGLFGLSDGLFGRNDPLWPPKLQSRHQATADSPGILEMKLVDANRAAGIEGLEELPGKCNYFIGNDPKKWHTDIPTYRKVTYKGVYPGVDLVYYGNQRELEYDFAVAPGADPNQVRLALAGGNSVTASTHQQAVSLQIDPNGDLVAGSADGEIRFHKPILYQPALDQRRRTQNHDGQRPANLLPGHFILKANHQISFGLSSYDRTKPLIIDPTLSYSTYLGGSGSDVASGIAVDATGNAYIAGYTYSVDFPTQNPLQPSNHGYANAFVCKVSPSGSALVYSTYLGGSSPDHANAIAVDPSGSAYLTGDTQSTDFPTVGPLQPAYGGQQDAFVTKLNPNGSELVYSTYLGGSNDDQGLGIAVDPTGNAYVTGRTSSSDFPTYSPLQPSNAGTYNAFVAKLNSTGSAFVYSTYLGGNGIDLGWAIAVDSMGNAFIAGSTRSTNFPTMNALQPHNAGDTNCFVTELNPAGSEFVYSTYLGGSNVDEALGIAVDATDSAYVTGYSISTDFPTVNPIQANCSSCLAYGYSDAFVAKVNPTGNVLVYSTYLGGNGTDTGASIAVDDAGSAYVTGSTESTDFPTSNAIQPQSSGFPNAFVTKLNPAGTALAYSTYLGGSSYAGGSGIAVDSSQSAYVVGGTSSGVFPTVNPIQDSNAGGDDAFVAKISPGSVPAVTLSASSLAFGNQTVSESSPAQSLTVTNSGNADLSISTAGVIGTNATDFSTNTDTCSGSNLAPSGTCAIGVTFTPTATGPRTATLIITDNNNGVVGSTQSVALTGTGIQASIAISSVNPSSVTLVQGGNSQTVTVALTSTNYTGTVTLATSTLPSGVTATIAQPGTGTSGTITLQAASNATLVNNQTITITASGNGISPASASFTLSVAAQTTATTLPATSITSNSAIMNGTINSGGASGTARFIWGPDPDLPCCSVGLGVDAISTTQTFSYQLTGLATNTTYYYRMRFDPDSNGSQPQGDIVSFTTLGGTGTPILSVSPNNLNFGIVITQGSPLPSGTPTTCQTLPITISNSNTATASLSFPSNAFALSGADPGDFTINPTANSACLVPTGVNACSVGASLAPNQSCVLYVGFTPQATASRSATLTVSSIPSGTQPVTLTGVGMPYFNQCDKAEPTIVPTSYDSGESTCSYGCALTSAAMILATFPDFASETPYSLDTYLNMNSLYSYDSQDGLHDLLDLADLPGHLYIPDPNLQAPSLSDISYVTSYLQQHVTAMGQRVILHFNMTGTLVSGSGQCAAGDHFAAVVGPWGSDDWQLADPGWSATIPSTALFSLQGHLVGGFETSGTSSTGETITCYHTFSVKNVLDYGPSPSAGSVEFKALSPVELLITDSQGRRLGNVTSGVDVYEIPQSSYFRDFPLADDTGSGPAIGDPNGTKTAFISGPSSGPYTVTATGTASGTYTLDVRAVANDGSVQETTTSGATTLSSSAKYQVSYSPTPGTPLTVTPLPAVSLSPSGLTFNSQTVGTASQPQAVTIANTGVGPLAISSIAVQGNFAETNSCGTGVTAGANCTVNVTFTPMATGPLTGSLTITDNSNGVEGSTQTVTLNGTGVAAATTTAISAPPIIYGTNGLVAVSVASSVGTVTGVVTLSVDGGAPSIQNLSSGSTAFTLAGLTGGAHSLSASYAAQGNFLASSATGTLTVNKAASTTQITANTPNPSAPGQVVVASFQVTGNGTPTGNVTVTASTGESCSSTLTAGTGSCSLTFVTVGSRTVTASYLGDINFNGSSSARTTQSVNGPFASVSPSSINFGTVYLATITLKSVTVTNQGNAALTISDPFLSIVSGGNSKEFVAVNLCPKSLAAGKSCTMEITFIAGPFYTPQTATLSVRDNAYKSPQTVALTATVINPQAWLSPTSLSFSKQKVNTTSAGEVVTLKNTGATPLTITSIAVAGTNPSDFAEGNNCALSPASLAASASCTVNITFEPTAKGSRSGIVVITDNAQFSPQKILLSGTGD
jgi:hypothetical protein